MKSIINEIVKLEIKDTRSIYLCILKNMHRNYNHAYTDEIQFVVNFVWNLYTNEKIDMIIIHKIINEMTNIIDKEIIKNGITIDTLKEKLVRDFNTAYVKIENDIKKISKKYIGKPNTQKNQNKMTKEINKIIKH